MKIWLYLERWCGKYVTRNSTINFLSWILFVFAIGNIYILAWEIWNHSVSLPFRDAQSAVAIPIINILLGLCLSYICHREAMGLHWNRPSPKVVHPQ